MEYLFFGALVLAFIVAVICLDIYRDRKKQRLFEDSLRRDYGILRKREYNLERFVRIDRYYCKHPEADQIDDVTWNDLDLDEVFKSMNHTYSAVGEEFLYHTLRSAGKDQEYLGELEGLIEYFRTHEDQRVFLQLVMAKLGYMGKYSLYDYLDNLDYLGERTNRKAFVCNLLFLPLLALAPFYFSYAMIGLVGLMLYNIMTYFKEKGEIEPYIVSFVYVLKLLDACERLDKMPGREKETFLGGELERIHVLKTSLKPMRKGTFWVVSGNGSLGGNPMDVFVDYLKMTFHVDLIIFNRMLKFLRANVDTLDTLITSLGRLETAIAIGAWREGLQKANGFTVPRIGAGLELRLEEGYHPLLSQPVKNSIETKRGVLLTGSNASGKSTFLKTVALNAILAQTVHTCTASCYEAPLFRIFSSMALRDDLGGGDSYYIVEIKALKRILSAAKTEGRPVLCFVDEVLRGTNTVERIAASTQILKSLLGEGILCFAATHDIELTELLGKLYDNYHFEEEIKDGDITFQYRLLEGKATTRNAIKLLKIIGYDETITGRAEEMAEIFLKTGQWR